MTPRRKVTEAKQKAAARKGRTVDAAVAEAKRATAARGRKPGLAAHQIALRDSAMVARSAQGWTAKRIAAEFGCTDRTVRRALAEFRAAPSGMEVTPMQVVEDLLRTLRGMLGDFEGMAFAYAGDYPAVALQAKRQARETLADLVALQRMLGVIPGNLGIFRAEADLRHLGETVLDKLAELERGECEAGDVARLVREDVMAQALRDLPTRN